jgi:transcriptional regulator with XRE-family HTH domain
MKERIKEVRHHLGLTQAAFAVRINKTSGFISNVETGRCGMSDTVLQTVSSIFGVNYEWLKTGKGYMFVSGEEKSAVDKEKMGERIKIVRKRSGLTQEEFADRIGFHKNQVHYVEVGKSYPSDDFLWKVSSRFNISIDWLKTGTGDMAAEPIDRVDEELINWLRQHPEVVNELRARGGLDLRKR